MSTHIDPRHVIGDPGYVARCKTRLDADGALVLKDFFVAESITQIVDESLQQQDNVFYADSTHNVYLTGRDALLADDHVFNRQVASSKGLLADDQIPANSALREVYNDPSFRSFLAAVLGIGEVHPYADDLSSINVNFASAGQELGWHFDNSAFAVTMLLCAPESGGVFEYVPAVRDADGGDMAFERVASVLDGREAVRDAGVRSGCPCAVSRPRCNAPSYPGRGRYDSATCRVRLQRRPRRHSVRVSAHNVLRGAPPNPSWWWALADGSSPVVGISGSARLHIDERLTKPEGVRTRLTIAHRNRAAFGNQRADWSDDGSGAR